MAKTLGVHGGAVTRGRELIIALVACWILFGPAARHIWHVQSPVAPGWFMYRGTGIGVCDVRLYHRLDGTDTRLNRATTLGYRHWTWMSNHDKTLFRMREVIPQLARVCEVLGPDADLRAEVRCGGHQGWVQRLDREDDLCANPPKRPGQ